MGPSLTTHTTSHPETAVDERPRFAIGHISLGVRDLDRALAFYTEIGMRPVVNMGHAAILELRGGTHVIIHQSDGQPGSLDLIVDDIDDTHATLSAAGAEPSSIERGFPHDRFVATDLEGNTLVVASNHAVGVV